MAGVPFGINPAMVDEVGRNLSLSTGLALCAGPMIGGLLSLGLTHRWGRVLPAWVPVLGGRDVPRMLALVPAAVITVALVSYGLIGIEIIVRALVQGTVSWAQVAGDWAVSATEVIFLFWGAALGIATWGYYLASRHPSGPTAVPSVQETRSAH